MAKSKVNMKVDAPAIKFPEWIDDHPAVKMFQKMRLKDFAMICHFFGYLMVPEAKIKKLVENAALLKTVMPTKEQVDAASKAIGVARVNNKGEKINGKRGKNNRSVGSGTKNRRVARKK